MKNYGLDISKIQIKPEDYKFGSNIPLDVLKHDGQWDDYLPTYEPQAENYETWGCTVWGTQNQIECLMKFAYGIEPNYDERYNYNLVELTEPGGDPQNVYQSIRDNGLVEGMFPPTSTYEEFSKPRPMDELSLIVGKKWLKEYELTHEWITPSNPEKMKELIVSALMYSPVALSVTAWTQDENGLYIDRGFQNNHWTLCYGYRDTPEGVVLKIFDSYDHSKKELHPNHFVYFAKRIAIKKKVVEVKKKNLFSQLWQWFLKEKLVYRAFKIFNINNK